MTAGLAVAHAVLFAAAFPSLGLWPLTCVAVVPLYWLAVGAPSARRALVTVLLVQCALWLWINRWLVGVTAVGYPLLALYMSLYAVLFVWVVRRWSAHPRLGRLPAVVVVPVVWVGLEFLRGELVLDGYPWFLAGHPLIEWPLLAQSADLLGAYFVSFLATMVGGLVIDALRLWAGGLARSRFVVSTASVLVLFAVNFAYGGWRLRQSEVADVGPTFLAVQTNLPQNNKMSWLPEQQVEDLLRFVALTEQAHEAAVGAGALPDLVIWPETMLPGFGLEPETIRTLVDGDYFPGDAFSRVVEDLARRLATPLLVGSPAYLGLRPVERRWEWDRHYNSAYLVVGDPPFPRYDKVFLTPFGETMPYISSWPWLEQRLLALGARGMRFDLDAAPSIALLELHWSPPGDSRLKDPLVLATPICFEDTVAPLCRRMIYRGGRKRADVLVNLSNDGWFGAHDAGRAQHGQIARFRCIENRVPMIRCVNTGMSMAVDSAGRMLGTVGYGRYGTGRRSGWVWSELPLDSRGTLYGRTGELWGWACLLATLGLGTAAAWPRGHTG